VYLAKPHDIYELKNTIKEEIRAVPDSMASSENLTWQTGTVQLRWWKTS